MKTIFYIILNLCMFGCAAQLVSFKNTVFDQQTRNIIPYSTVQVLNTNIIRDADEKGYFEITANNFDTLTISCIGYTKKKIPVTLIKNNDSIFLIKEIVTLPILIIAKPVVQKLGIIDEKRGRSCSGGSEAERLEIAALIEIPDNIKLYKITKALIKGKNFKGENPIRLHIYDLDSNKLPGKELLNKELIITDDNCVEGVMSIDLKDQQIFLENTSFFIGVQWMTSTKVKLFTGPEIFETFKVKKLLTFRRQKNINNNKWFGCYKSIFIFYPNNKPPPDDTPINILASAEIEIFPQ